MISRGAESERRAPIESLCKDFQINGLTASNYWAAMTCNRRVALQKKEKNTYVISWTFFKNNVIPWT